MKSWAKARLAAASISFALAHAGMAVGDVLGDRAGEDHRVLCDDADLLSQAAERRVADVDAVDHDAALLRIVEAREQREQRRLARAVAADDRDAICPLGTVRLTSSTAGCVRVRVGERDVLETDLALDRREVFIADVGTSSVGSPLLDAPCASARRVAAAFDGHSSISKIRAAAALDRCKHGVHLAHAAQRFADADEAGHDQEKAALNRAILRTSTRYAANISTAPTTSSVTVSIAGVAHAS